MSQHGRIRSFASPIPATVVAALFAVLGLMFAGCGVSNPYPAGSYERGHRFYESGQHREATEAFAQFLRRAPSDSMAPQAQMEKARSYVAMKEYPMAAVELQILRQEYPTSPLLEESAFLEAEAHFKQVGHVKRDIGEAFVARDLFREFLARYPISIHAPQAREYLLEISDIAVRKVLKAIDVYRHLGKWESVAVSLDRILAAEPDSRLRDRVYWERARAAMKLDQPTAATGFLEALLQNHPESVHAEEARSLLAEIRPQAEP